MPRTKVEKIGPGHLIKKAQKRLNKADKRLTNIFKRGKTSLNELESVNNERINAMNELGDAYLTMADHIKQNVRNAMDSVLAERIAQENGRRRNDGEAGKGGKVDRLWHEGAKSRPA